MVRYPSYELIFSIRLPLVVVIEYMAFAYNCKVREEATLEQVRDRYYSNLIYLLDHFRQVERLDVIFSPPFHEVREIINISNLRWNSYTLLILSSYLAIVD